MYLSHYATGCQFRSGYKIYLVPGLAQTEEGLDGPVRSWHVTAPFLLTGNLQQAYDQLKEAAYMYSRMCDDLHPEACACLSSLARLAYLQTRSAEVSVSPTAVRPNICLKQASSIIIKMGQRCWLCSEETKAHAGSWNHMRIIKRGRGRKRTLQEKMAVSEL